MPVARKDQIAWQPGGFYHLHNRGAHRQTLFREPANYLFVLHNPKKYCRELHLSMIAYCLLPNHYHFLIRQNEEHPAGLLCQRLFNSYSKAYNKMYSHSGTLFESRYHARALQNDPNLFHLCRYIHANPVKHGLVECPEDWPYSNYLEWIGERGGGLVDREFIAGHFPDPRGYAAFVADFLSSRQMPESLKYLERW